MFILFYCVRREFINIKLKMISQEFQKKLMNVDDTTMYLGLSVNTIRSWVRRRCVPYVKINGALRFDRKKIDSWIERNKHDDINESEALNKWASLRN